MKHQYTFKNLKQTSIIFMLVLFCSHAFAQTCPGNEVTMSIENVIATTNTIEFDLYLENTGTTDIRLVSCQGNVRYDAGLSTAGTFTVVTQPTVSFPTLNNISAVANTVSTRQLRWAHTPTSSANAAMLPAHVPMKFARFRFTTTSPVAWAMDATTAFTFTPDADIQPGITTNMIVGYCNGNTSAFAIQGSGGGMVFRGSPTFLIGNLLSTPTIDQSVGTTAFPNPFSDTFKMNLPYSGEINVKVYDMVGRLVEATHVKAADAIKKDWGAEYKSGVYNMIVLQGQNQQTLRIVKK